MEELAALYVLWLAGFGSKESYVKALDELFLEDPENDALLELEGLCGDPRATLARLSPFIGGQNADGFGRALLAGLERYYKENVTDYSALERFTHKTHELWSSELLPFDIANKDPFFFLCCADDYLFYRGDDYTREQYRKTFDYYK
ncbi:MAG: hypothetical protein NC299_12035 [Lachnospiraceae bacterium]|nr:hypothetical protein [Ruminococcus sp.]MCM1276072.1 hypothetical protein [Lachnospiraceae bacterium]